MPSTGSSGTSSSLPSSCDTHSFLTHPPLSNVLGQSTVNYIRPFTTAFPCQPPHATATEFTPPCMEQTCSGPPRLSLFAPSQFAPKPVQVAWFSTLRSHASCAGHNLSCTTLTLVLADGLSAPHADTILCSEASSEWTPFARNICREQCMVVVATTSKCIMRHALSNTVLEHE